jgi:prepilin-type N-terminal cleavage/methylation domain-containing protein
MNTFHQRQPRRPTGAFTLIELLVVIAIIGVIAALILSGSAYASKTVKIRRAQTELNELITALEAYKARLGFYPPDNADPSRPPLYYELSGMYEVGGNNFTTTDGGDTLATAAINTAFGVGGFANTAPNRAEAQRFLNELKDRNIHDDGGIKFLRSAIKNLEDEPLPVWNYVSRNPTNNPKAFDLWTVLYIGTNPVVVGNWRSGQ